MSNVIELHKEDGKPCVCMQCGLVDLPCMTLEINYSRDALGQVMFCSGCLTKATKNLVDFMEFQYRELVKMIELAGGAGQ